jgi:hypothetical protein
MFVYGATGFYFSTDNGLSWNNVASNPVISPNCYTFSSDSKNIFAGTRSVYVSTDRGIHWTNETPGLPDNIITNLISSSDGTTIYAGTHDQGLWMCRLSDLVTSVNTKDNSIIPSRLVLEQNYPNPFNPTTTIEYGIPLKSFVTIKLFDILGREVAVLVNGERQAGAYKIEFNASRFSSGIYIYQLRSGSLIQTKKMMLLK